MRGERDQHPCEDAKRDDQRLFLPEEALELGGQALDELLNAEDLHPLSGPAGRGEMERKTRVELATSSLARRRSTTELLPRCFKPPAVD